MNSLTEENYLKALFNIANENGEVNVTELSKRLSIKMPTVTSMMKKLSEKKLVLYERNWYTIKAISLYALRIKGKKKQD
jgi:DtxR family Mn-dependent transcriptional regulator